MQSRKKVQQLSSVSNPQKVKVLILGDQKSMYSDFYFLTRFTGIIKLDLSFNKISSFPVGFSFKIFTNLKTLFLHYNKFNSLKSLIPVSESKILEYLTLFGNHLQETKTRHFLINEIPNLKMMDERIVMNEQRSANIVMFDSCNNGKYDPKITYPIITVLESEGSQQFLSAVIQELTIIRNKYLEVNPVVKIQRWIKKNLQKRKKENLKQRLQNGQQKQTEIRLQTDPFQRQQKESLKNRLITEKMLISKSNEQKVLSIFKMNFQFFAIMKQKANQHLYAEKQYCEKNKIKYEHISDRYLCLRLNTFNNKSNKSFLQLIMKISQGYLIRSRGKKNSLSSRQYPIFNQFMRKKKQKVKQCDKPDQSLKMKMQILNNRYQDQLVKVIEEPDVKFHLLKQSYMKIKSDERANICQYFPFCIKEVFDRTVAAVAIQRIWRGSRVRKIINTKIIINRKFAAIRIQRWVRSLGTLHRCSFMSQVRQTMKKDNTKTLTLPIQQIIKLEQKHKKNFKGVNFILKDQLFRYCLNKNLDNDVQAKICQIDWNPMIIPSYMKDMLKYCDLRQKQFKEQVIKNSEGKQTMQNFAGLLFSHAESIKNWSTKSKKQMVTLNYKTLKEAKIRKFLLALVSYDFKSKKYAKNLDQDLPKIAIDIRAAIDERYFISIGSQKEQKCGPLQNRLASNLKIKFFANQKDLTETFKVFLPKFQQKVEPNKKKPLKQVAESIANNRSIAASSRPDQIDRSNNYKVGLNISNIHNNIMKLSIQGRQSQGINQTKNHKIHNKSQHISNDIIYPKQDSKKDGIKKLNRSKLSRYHNPLNKQWQSLDQQSHNQFSYHEQHNKSLEKSQSLRPNNNYNQLASSLKEQPQEHKKVLNTDIYYSARDSDIHNEAYFNSLSQLNLQSEEKDSSMQSYNQFLQLQRRKRIQQLKQSHNLKIRSNQISKELRLRKIKEQNSEKSMMNEMFIKITKSIANDKNVDRHDRIKAIFSKNRHESARYSNHMNSMISHDKSSVKSIDAGSPRQQFEKQFLKKGNRSMKFQLLKFEKSRQFQSISLQHTKNLKKNLASISQKGLQDQNVSKSLRKKKLQAFKTQIKQFSVDFDDTMPGEYSLANFQLSKQSSRRQSPQSKLQKGKKKNRNSQDQIEQKQKINAQKISSNHHKNHNIKKPDAQFNSYKQQISHLEQNIIDNRIKQAKKSKNADKLRKIVHSVFPEEFYPLHQSKKLGFHLPRLGKGPQQNQ